MERGLATFSKFKPTLKQRPSRREKGRAKIEYFIPYQMMTPKMQKAYRDQLVEYDEDAQEVEDVIGDVTDGIDLLPNTSAELTEAKLQNIRARTAVLEEKLEAHKKEMFADWSEKFFEVFTDCFAKLKNAFISLHLNEEQITILNDTLEMSLKNMDAKLSQIWNEFDKNEEDQPEQ